MVYYLVFILLALGDLFFWWWGDRRLRQVPKAAIWRGLLGVLIGGQFVLMVWWVLFPSTLRPLGNSFWKPVSAWLYMWHLLVLPATLVFLFFGYLVIWIRDLLAGAIDWIRQPPQIAASTIPPENKTYSSTIGSVTGPVIVYPSRRQILAAASTFAPQAALGCALMKAASQAGKFRIRRLEIALPQLPPALSGMTIAHVSDTHVGRFVGAKELESVVAATAGLSPDLIVFTGDLIDFSLSDLPPALDAMRDLQKIAPLAMCVGNHDLFEDGAQFRRRVGAADVGLMLDETMSITLRGQKIELLGLDWGTQAVPRADGIQEHMRSLLARRNSAFPILLAHHPHAFDPAAAAGIPLTLSGHTHGGQIMITKNFGAGRVYRYWSGLYQKGASKLVVSNGVGNWFPLRINAPAEIIQLTLRRA
jgi:predicted MPP superfamily phosphohydrolase